MKKVIFGIMLISLLIVCGGCSGGYTSDEPCKWGGETPTKEFETTKGEKNYICEKHSHTCVVCNQKFDKELNHYTNGLGIVTFACDDCYADLTQ